MIDMNALMALQLIAQKENVTILNTMRDTTTPMWCRVCKGTTYSYALVFSKVTASLTEKLYNINYTRAGNIFGKFHKTKACCQRIATRLAVKDFKLSKNDKQVYHRFLNFLRGSYSLEKEEEEKKEDMIQKQSPKQAPGQAIRNEVNAKLSKEKMLGEKLLKLEELLKRHKLVLNLKNNSVSSNLALIAFHQDKSTPLAEYQKVISDTIVEAVVGTVQGKLKEVELHPKGFINIFFDSLAHLDPPKPEESKTEKKGNKAKKGKQEEKKEEQKKVYGEGKTNLQQYFDQIIPLGQSEGLAHSYEVRVELALYSDQKYELFKQYFHHVHDTHYPDTSGFENFLCNSPVYDPDNMLDKLRIPTNSQSNNDKSRELKSEGPNPQFRGSYHMLHYIDGELAAVGVLDVLDTILVSCQLMYAHKYKQLNLGRLCLLREIEWARQMAKLGRGITHYCLQDYAATWPKFAYKVDYHGTELLCPHTNKWIPFSKEKIRPMLQAKNNNLTGLKKQELEEQDQMLQEWANIEVEELKDKAEIMVGFTVLKLWPELASPESEKQVIDKCREVITSLTPEIYEALSIIYFVD